MEKFLLEGKKVGGYVLLETVLAMIAFSMLSMAFFTIFSGQFSMINSSADAMQAQQYAEIDAQQLRLMNYYDLDDEGAKSRSAMTSWSNPNNLWEDEITIGNELVIDDYTQSKQRIATIKIYRQGDTLPRFSFEVPISSQGSGVPIGSIVAWGVDSNPNYDGGTYLECDGSTFDTNKYKRLYEVLGTNKLPNYQGMFLRGAGSQSYSQVNGDYFVSSPMGEPNEPIIHNNKTAIEYKSAEKVGEIQGDSFRPLLFNTPNMLMSKPEIDEYYSTLALTYAGNQYYPFKDSYGTYWTSAFVSSGNKSNVETRLFNFTKPKHFKYEPQFSTFSTEEGSIRYVSGLVEKEVEIESGDEGYFEDYYKAVINNSARWSLPVSNEIRPVNVAVKFMIKAK